MRLDWRRLVVPGWYAALALLASGPLFAGPYLLTLDAVFGPNMSSGPTLLGASQQEGPGVLMVVLVDILGRVVGVPNAVRLLFAGSLFAMGLAMHAFCPTPSALGKLFAGTLYVVNPYTYVRVLSGQWYVLPSLAGLALALWLVRRVARGDGRAVVPLALALALSGMMVQVAPLALGLCVLVVLADALAQRQAPDLKRLALAGGLWLLLSAYWLAPLLLRGSASLAAVGAGDFAAFAPRSRAPTGLLLDLLGLYGFWHTGYEMPREHFRLWWAWSLLLVFLAALGVARGGRSRPALLALALAGAAATLVAFLAGLAADAGEPFALAGLPGMGMYRDAHKLLALLLVAYAACGGVAVGALLARVPAGRPAPLGIAGAVVALVAVAGTGPMLSGWGGQVRAQEYPPEWHEAKRVIEAGPDGGVLVLPWHLYMEHSWVEGSAQRIANPARVFLDRPVLAGDTPELAGATEGPRDPVSLYVERVVLPARNASAGAADLANLLAPLHVSHVMLLKDGEWPGLQAWLGREPGLDLALENDRLLVYRTAAAGARVYAPEAHAGGAGREDAWNASLRGPLDRAYLAAGGRDAPLGELRGVDAGPTRIEPEADGVVVLAARQHEAAAWAWTGRPAPPHLGALPTGDASEGGAFAMGTFWRVRLPGYVVTLGTLAGLAAWAAWRRP